MQPLFNWFILYSFDIWLPLTQKKCRISFTSLSPALSCHDASLTDSICSNIVHMINKWVDEMKKKHQSNAQAAAYCSSGRCLFALAHTHRRDRSSAKLLRCPNILRVVCHLYPECNLCARVFFISPLPLSLSLSLAARLEKKDWLCARRGHAPIIMPAASRPQSYAQRVGLINEGRLRAI